MNPQAERRVGTVIGGKWRVDALLGSGSMAAVYAVTHRNGARAALKILHPTLCTDPSVCERFLGEGYLTNSVKHQGIVRVLDDGVTDDGCVFLVMDLLEGDTLEALRQKRGGKISLPETLDLADKLMDVLSAVHAAGIIHRDLKPQNVFVCNDGTVKLLDFGVARVFDRTSQSKLSMFGLVLGTPSFMSPEQALGSRDKVDHRADIWSLGATLFTALTGETVHLGANVQAKLLAAATVKARSLQMVMPSLPPAIAAAIDMSLRFKKEDRWQNVDAMRRSFREARLQLGLDRPQSVAPPPFDLSLDETTSVDKGTPKFESGAPLGPPPAAHGPDGTFIGIGDSVGRMMGVVGNDGSVPPADPPPQATDVAGPAMVPPGGGFGPQGFVAPPGATPQPSPAAVVRNLPGAVDLSRRASRPDGQEGSIPAYGGTVKLGPDESYSEVNAAAMGVPRKGGVGVGLVAVALAGIALGGIAFFAVKRGPFAVADPPPSLDVPPPTPSLLPTITTATTEPAASILITPPEPPLVDAGGASSTAPRGAPAPWRGGGAAHRGGRPASSAAGGDAPPPSSASEAPRPPPPGLAPDPFGTPE